MIILWSFFRFALSIFVLYAIIRLAVKHGIQDAKGPRFLE